MDIYFALGGFGISVWPHNIRHGVVTGVVEECFIRAGAQRIAGESQ